METLHVSLFSVVEDLAHDWLYLQHNKHSRHVLGVHKFVSLTEGSPLQHKYHALQLYNVIAVTGLLRD